MILIRSILPLAVALLTVPAYSQLELHFDPNIPVQYQGNTLDLAWAGGLNFVQVGQVDLNGDGLKDLFLFDKSYISGNKPVILLRTAGTGTAAYRVTRDYDAIPPFDQLHDWALLRDYDCDGKEDIFTYSQAGFSVFKNISDASGPAFQMIKYRVNSNYVAPSGAGSIANLFISQVDVPGIADVDNDGDLDILTFSLLGSYVEYHKNLSMETYGTCDSLLYEVRNKCWGYFAENFSNNSVTLNVPCQFNVPNPEIGLDGDANGDGSRDLEDTDPERAHAGSTVTPLDLNGDGVMDMLLGDISFNNLVGLHNGGTALSAIIAAEDTLFPPYDTPTDLAVFPGSYYVDVDQDGRRDLIASPNASNLAQNYRSMWYYRNEGTDAAPVFEFQQQNLFQDRMLEFGEGAMPVPFDENGDGLMDLLVANHGYYQNGGTYLAKIALLRNTGTLTAPAFSMITDDYLNLSTSGIGLSMYPAFGDIDNDGDKDLYIGDLQGRLHFYRNNATGPVAQFQLIQANILDSEGAMIDVGQFATPIFTDLDMDGKLDLVIGERNGNLNYYRNTGTVSAPVWSLVNENLGEVNTVEYWNVTGHSVPFMFRNDQNEREMLLGSESGWIFHYGDIEGNIDGAWTLLDSTFMDIHDGARTGLCLYDYTGDGELDMVVGNFRGGLSFWRSDVISTVVPVGPLQSTFSMMPNPVRDRVELLAGPDTPAKSEWVFRNTIGQVVLREPVRGARTVVELDGLPEGVYLVRMEGGATSGTQRLAVVR
ncbi:MAG: VCBS repeat-containing protein [Flavobacteriales bacterium]|nr:VCBS repeat-containing protein [Flavobacteriales bacterium]MCC6937736.1 VCBS repeat-containing protein [Flavobacteriales bacterium]